MGRIAEVEVLVLRAELDASDLPELFDSPLRRDLVSPPEPALVDGRMPLPDGPGLGIELDADAVARYRVD
jgi:L-alanine-DL-glutamate epimerase-like enolase superfamily enzyme